MIELVNSNSEYIYAVIPLLVYQKQTRNGRFSLLVSKNNECEGHVDRRIWRN